jgi:prophage regulatory protein
VIVSKHRLVSFSELKERFGIPFTRRHLHNLEQAKKFPARVPIGENRVGWVQSEIEKWVEDRMQARSS